MSEIIHEDELVSILFPELLPSQYHFHQPTCVEDIYIYLCQCILVLLSPHAHIIHSCTDVALDSHTSSLESLQQ
jgi:hypothetical protein